MGARLAAYYAEAEGLFGLDGKIQLAMLTRITSTRALIEPDSPDNVHKFEGAIGALRRQHAVGNSNGIPASRSQSERGAGPHQAVADGEQLFWGVLGALHDSVVGVFERDGRCLMVWESRSLEQRYATPDGTTVGDAMARLVSSHCADELRVVFDGGATHHTEIACTLQGQRVWLSVSLSAAHDARGSVLGVHAFIRDITEQKRYEESMRRSEARLREHSRVYVELMSHSELLDDPEASLRQITEAGSRTLDVGRTGVWFFDESNTRLVCADLYDGRGHARGHELSAERYPAYFDAVRRATTLAVHDALIDPRTECLAEAVLKPFQIHSLLVTPIWGQGKMVGVLCHEQVGAPRLWMPDEENFAHMLASFVALSLQLSQRSGRQAHPEPA